jgi:hypothetical protein
MRSSIYLSSAIIFILPLSFASENVNELFDSISKQPTPENMAEIGLKLRGTGRYAPHGERYTRIQAAILSIPGHAEFYAKPIWESYSAYRDPTHPKHQGSATDFSWQAKIGLETLKNLPSPETVKVLGQMLGEDWEAERGAESRESDMTYPSAMAYQAAWTFGELPLRKKPSPPFERYQVKDYLPAWQEWYEKVKSGEIPFSFKGEAVEYRFNPDGTWVTLPLTNPPDDAPELPNTTDSAERTRKIPTTKAQPEELDDPTSRNLLIGLAALMALAGAWFYLRRMKPR